MCVFTCTILPQKLYILARPPRLHKSSFRFLPFACLFPSMESFLDLFQLFLILPPVGDSCFFSGENWQDPPSFNLRFVGKIERQIVSSFGSPLRLLSKPMPAFEGSDWTGPQLCTHKGCRTQMATIQKDCVRNNYLFWFTSWMARAGGEENQTCLRVALIIW